MKKTLLTLILLSASALAVPMDTTDRVAGKCLAFQIVRKDLQVNVKLATDTGSITLADKTTSLPYRVICENVTLAVLPEGFSVAQGDKRSTYALPAIGDFSISVLFDKTFNWTVQ